MKKQDHEARLVKRAKKMAKTGRHNGWFYVARELRDRGEPLAMELFVA
jgi:hypothetical protein